MRQCEVGQRGRGQRRRVGRHLGGRRSGQAFEPVDGPDGHGRCATGHGAARSAGQGPARPEG